MSNTNFNTLVSTTLKNYRTTLTDNITGHNALWYQLKERGFIREEDGGTSIVEPLLIGRNSTVRSYRGKNYSILRQKEVSPLVSLNGNRLLGQSLIAVKEKLRKVGGKPK